MLWKYDLALALMQYTLGTYFFVSGCRKCWAPDTQAMIRGLFQRLRLSNTQLHLVTYGQVLGGAALLTGFLDRLAAAMLIPIMVGAIYLVKWPRIKRENTGRHWTSHVCSVTQSGEVYMLIGLVMLILLGPTRWTLL
jgi:uncharacterized membrane protein YphA (DoxX/SURF4 family)